MNAYIIAGFRSAVGKAPRGKFRFTRPDDLAAHVVNHLVGSVPGLERDRIDDVIVGNATPEAEQGLNIGRMISLMGLIGVVGVVGVMGVSGHRQAQGRGVEGQFLQLDIQMLGLKPRRQCRVICGHKQSLRLERRRDVA
jgi:hypothetical protein